MVGGKDIGVDFYNKRTLRWVPEYPSIVVCTHMYLQFDVSNWSSFWPIRADNKVRVARSPEESPLLLTCHDPGVYYISTNVPRSGSEGT